MGLRTSLKVQFDCEHRSSLDYEISARATMPGIPDFTWPDGTVLNTADQVYADTGVTLATASTRNLDLRSLTTPLGVSQQFVEVRLIMIRCRDYALTFAKGAANGWTGLGSAWTMTLPAGTWFCITNPLDAKMPTTASDKVIDISNASGQTATYDVIFVGTTA
jgi:hypothetical protein